MLTITNPMTIMSFLGAFAGLGMGGSQTGIASAAALVIGVFVGSAIWWLVLSLVIGVFRDRIHVLVLGWINRVSGVLLTMFGLIAIIGLLLEE